MAIKCTLLLALKYTFSLFVKAHLTGSLEHLSFLDEIYASGTLQQLNELDDNPESFRQFVESL